VRVVGCCVVLLLAAGCLILAARCSLLLHGAFGTIKETALSRRNHVFAGLEETAIFLLPEYEPCWEKGTWYKVLGTRRQVPGTCTSYVKHNRIIGKCDAMALAFHSRSVSSHSPSAQHL
jgi:hypothetical protein